MEALLRALAAKQTVEKNVASNLTKGFSSTYHQPASGTAMTPDVANGGHQYIVASGNFTFTAPTPTGLGGNSCSLVVVFENPSTYTFATSGFTKVDGDNPSGVAGTYKLYVTVIGSVKHLIIRKVT